MHWLIFFSFFTRHKDERVGVSFIHGHSTCTSFFYQDTFLPSSPARNGFSGLTSVLAYLPSTPIAAIFQAARLWYYDYYISFSFFSSVPSLWFHLKVHWHGLSEVVEFHLPPLVFSRTLLHSTTGETLSHTLPTDPFPELWGHTVQSHKILRNDPKLSNADYMLSMQIMYTLHPSSMIWRLIMRESRMQAIISRTAFPHRTECIWSTACDDRTVIGWCWCMLQ